MTTETTNDAVTESTEQVSTPISETVETANETPEVSQEANEGFISSSTSVADQIAAEAEQSSDDGDDVDVSDEEIDSIIDEITNESSDGDVSEESTDGEKTNTQKRIDQLTAQKKAAEEQNEALLARLEKLEADINAPKPEAKAKNDTISDREITQALGKYIEEGDFEGIVDIINYKVQQGQDAIKAEYQAEQQKTAAARDAMNTEWNNIAKEYAPAGYEDPFLAEDADFDSSDQNSQLYKMAQQIYTEAVNRGEVLGPQDMRKAVELALKKLLLKKVNGKKVSNKTTKSQSGIENRLAKEQRKNKIGGGASSTDNTPSKPRKATSILDEVIGERNKLTRSVRA